MSNVNFLAKVSKLRHLETLIEKGELHFGRVPDYRKNERENLKYDQSEGILYQQSATGARLYMEIDEGEMKEVAKLVEGSVMRLKSSEFDRLSIHCMFSMNTSNYVNQLPESLGSSGDYVAVVTDIPEFINRIDTWTKKTGCKHYRDLVSYVDLSTHTEMIGPFIKDLRYKEQNEFRICVRTEDLSDQNMYLGNLENVIAIVPFQELTWKKTRNRKFILSHG